MSLEPNISEPEAAPLVISVETAGALLGISRPAAYKAIHNGSLPTLAGGGRKRVPVATLENLVGRRITAADVRAAEQRIAPKRESFLRYQRDYRAARAAQGRK